MGNKLGGYVVTPVLDLNWDKLKSGCVARKAQCWSAIERLQASDEARSVEERITGLENVIAELNGMIAECDANIGARLESEGEDAVEPCGMGSGQSFASSRRAEFAAAAA